MMDVSTSTTQLQVHLSPAALHRRFAASFVPKRWIYWCDFLASVSVGWGLFLWSASAPMGTALHAVTTVGAVFALLRAALFIHELAHLRPGDVPGFELAWNVLFGVPLLTPSLMYVGSHMDHHRRNAFGTSEDPEYVPMTHWGRLRLAWFVLTGLFVPVMLAIRWGVIAPLSYFVPPLRRLAVARMSTLVINTGYDRPEPRGRHVLRWRVQETAAMLWVWAVAGAFAAGWIAPALLVQAALVAGGVWSLNQARTLVAHGYHNEGEPVDTEGQLLDTFNLVGWSPITALVAPVGLRYHALHHYLPGLPYHSLGRVHRYLAQELPASSPYRRTLKASFEAMLTGLWQRAARSPSS